MSFLEMISEVGRNACPRAHGCLFAVGLALAALGCGEDAPAMPDAGPAAADAAPDAPDGTRVTFTSVGPPLLLAYRNVDEAWQSATKLDDTHYELYVRGPYLVTAVCRDGESIYVIQLGRTLDDGDAIETDACRAVDAFRLRGSLSAAQPISEFQLAVGNSTRLRDGTSFDVLVPAGTLDLVVKANDRVAFRRGIEVTGDTTLTNPINLDREGFELIPVTTSITNAQPNETITTALFVQTGTINAFFDFRISPSNAVIPDVALQPSERQLLYVGGRGHTVRRVFREGSSTEITFPPPLAPVSFTESGGVSTATWSTLATYDTISFSTSGNAIGQTERFVSHELTATASYIQALGLTKLTHELDVPGLLPAWQVDLAQPYTGGFRAQHTVGDDTLTSSTGFRANQPPTAGGPEGELAGLPLPEIRGAVR